MNLMHKSEIPATQSEQLDQNQSVDGILAFRKVAKSVILDNTLGVRVTYDFVSENFGIIIEGFDSGMTASFANIVVRELAAN